MDTFAGFPQLTSFHSWQCAEDVTLLLVGFHRVEGDVRAGGVQGQTPASLLMARAGAGAVLCPGNVCGSGWPQSQSQG